LALNPHYTHRPRPGGFECNRLWVLKNSISQNWPKKLCARKPYKTTFLIFLDIFYPPNFRCLEKNGVFQQPRLFASTDGPIEFLLPGSRHAAALLVFGWWLRLCCGSSRTDLVEVTALVNGLQEFIYIAGRKDYGFAADTTNRQIGSRSGHGASGESWNRSKRPRRSVSRPATSVQRSARTLRAGWFGCTYSDAQWGSIFTQLFLHCCAELLTAPSK
jgi:hypothetical protein